MMEINSGCRWAFIRKIYSILTVQLLLTVAVCAAVVSIHPVAHFLVSTTPGLMIYIASLVLPFILLIPMYLYRRMHPLNFILLGLFTVSISILVGLTCAFINCRVIFEAASVTAALVVSLTLYTFWAASRGHDFQFLGPFLFCSLVTLICFGIIRIFFPLGKIINMTYGILGTIIFSGYIIYDTDDLIKRYGYDDYIWATVNLYLDMVNMFLCLLRVFRR
ncbi:unnamed protein product [Victoria cruziana]